MEKSKKLEGMTIGSRITELRRKKGWTMKQLADNAGVSQGQISYYERDQQSPNATNILRIAKSLEVPVSYIIQGDLSSPFEQLIPSIEKLPKSAQIDILKFIKDKISLARHRELDKQMDKEIRTY
jgi:transcriptional regulator with XRE-family HTH domain